MQKICQGIDRLNDALKGCRKVLLVCGRSFHTLGIRGEIESLDVTYVKFDGFSPNPLYEDVVMGVEKFRSEGCDALLAVGGGSAIDVAKCIKLASLSEERSMVLLPPLVNSLIEISKDTIPLIAIPTTAGSGSESTHNAVIYYHGEKQTVTNDVILPNFAFLDSSVLSTLPLYQKKCTMMDAFCQSIESWWSVNATAESRRYSQKAIELIVQNWEKYIFEQDESAAVKIMLAANYSGRAINIAQTTAAHAMSYKITSLLGLPHGYAVAICLPVIWEHMVHVVKDRSICGVFNCIGNAICSSSPEDAIKYFHQMMNRLGLQNPKSNNRTEVIEELSKSVNPIRMKNNPIYFTESEIKEIYSSIIG